MKARHSSCLETKQGKFLAELSPSKQLEPLHLWQMKQDMSTPAASVAIEGLLDQQLISYR